MPVVRTKLTEYLYVFPLIVLRNINQPLRNHYRNGIRRFAQSLHGNIHHVEALSKHLMAEHKAGDDFSHDGYLIVFNNLICHNPCSPFFIRSILYFLY